MLALASSICRLSTIESRLSTQPFPWGPSMETMGTCHGRALMRAVDRLFLLAKLPAWMQRSSCCSGKHTSPRSKPQEMRYVEASACSRKGVLGEQGLHQERGPWKCMRLSPSVLAGDFGFRRSIKSCQVEMVLFDSID